MDPTIAATLSATVYIARQNGVSASGQPTWGSPTAYPARVEQIERLEHTSQGQQLMTRNWVLMNSDAVVAKDDRIWLPGVDQTNAALARRVYEVAALPGVPPATTTDHFEVIV